MKLAWLLGSLLIVGCYYMYPTGGFLPSQAFNIS